MAMKKFKFRVYTKSDPEDGFWAWTTASSISEARESIKREYRAIRVEYFGQI